MEDIPLTEKASKIISKARKEATEIVKGNDDRLLVICGPCSIHDIKAAHEYAARLKPVAEKLSQDLLIVMRVYFEKPRTTVGWKGLINDPNLDGRSLSFFFFDGILTQFFAKFKLLPNSSSNSNPITQNSFQINKGLRVARNLLLELV